MNAAIVNSESAVQQLIQKAFDTQSKLNSFLREDWQTQGWPYYRAVWTELAEAVMHTNWAWWKHGTYGQPLSEQQVRDLHVELVDVLHFGLSMDVIAMNGNQDMISARAAEYEWAFEDAKHVKSADLTECLEGMVVDAILLREFNVKKFARACFQADLSLAQLVTTYTAKGILNLFRWSNGYNDKPRTYVKMWPALNQATVDQKVEDNVVMMAFLDELMPKTSDENEIIEFINSDAFTSALRDRLSGYYTARVLGPVSRSE